MKNKIKYIVLTLFCASFFLVSTGINAQNLKHRPLKQRAVKHRVAKHQINMAQAHKVMKNTNRVIVAAHKYVKLNKVYSGDLAKAVHHQKFAKKLLTMHKPHKALQHSRLAREYALISIRKNKGRIDNTWNISKEEQGILGTPIANANLDKELKAAMPNLKNNDQNITDKDMTDIEVLNTDPKDYKTE